MDETPLHSPGQSSEGTITNSKQWLLGRLVVTISKLIAKLQPQSLQLHANLEHQPAPSGCKVIIRTAQPMLLLRGSVQIFNLLYPPAGPTDF